jgi:glycosyltransferase involved in cell wall biosynthesis
VSGGSDVTVVIPVWDDYVQYLSQAVDSARREAPGARILIVDNASRTPVPALRGTEVVRATRRLSAGAARNLGLDQVETELVVFLDADDLLLTGSLEFMSSRMSSDRSMSVSATAILDGKTGRRHRNPRPFVHWFCRWRRTFAMADCIWSLYPIQGSALLRTQHVREAGGYPDANWGEDWTLAASLAFRGRVEVDKRLGRLYRPTEGSPWRRHRKTRELVESASRVRLRMRTDPAIPRWARAFMPVVFVLQLAAIYAVRPACLALRWILRLPRRVFTALRRTVVLAFERVVGIDTYGDCPTPASWVALWALFRRLEVSSNDIFADLGSGKGRVLFMAARRPFKRVIGVEIDAELNRIARDNLERGRGRRCCQSLEIETADVLDWGVPDDLTVALINEPAMVRMLDELAMKLSESFERNPRRLRLISLIPVPEEARRALDAWHVDELRAQVPGYLKHRFYERACIATLEPSVSPPRTSRPFSEQTRTPDST